MISTSLVQYYGNADIVDQSLIQYYGNASVLSASLEQLYDDAYRISASLEQIYSLPAVLTASIEQIYSIAGTELTAHCEQLYNLHPFNIVGASLVQPFALVDDSAQIQSFVVTVTAAGIELGFYDIGIEGGLDQFAMTCQVQLASQADYAQCKLMDELIITINGDEFVFFIESKSRNREHGRAEYTINGLSPSARLDKPYANNITEVLSGMAGDIVATLAAEFTVNWGLVPSNIPANILLPGEQSPMDINKQIAGAPGGVVQSEPNGDISIVPCYKTSVPQWDSCTPDHVLSDAIDWFSTGETFDHRPGYNRYLISDQTTSADSVTMETEELSEFQRIVKTYQVPWSDESALRHTGGDWITIEDLGIVEELIEDEIVQFVGGVGNTSKPIHRIVSAEWNQVDLGMLTPSDGAGLSAAVAKESLLKISYTTKYHKSIVTDDRVESVQVVADIPNLATIVVEFGTSAAFSDSIVVVELDEIFNVDADGNVKTQFAPEDRPGFHIHFDKRSLRIDDITTSSGMVVDRGKVTREKTEQMQWMNNEDSQELPHLPIGGVSWDWFGRTGDILQNERKLISEGDVPVIGDVSYQYKASAHTLIPPPLELDSGQTYPVLIVVKMEAA